MSILQIEYRKATELIPYDNNPRNNKDAIAKVAASIEEFGFKNPIIIDENDVIVAGHTRLLAAESLGYTEVPTLKVDDLTPEQIKAFRIADNKVAEIAEWDEELLARELEELKLSNYDLEMTGFDLAELGDLLEGFDEPDASSTVEEDDFDSSEMEQEEYVPFTKRGQVWQLGRHRLMCGDSTSKEDVEDLMNGNKAHMCFTDPPYNINYGNIKHPKFKQREIKNDNMSSDDFRQFCIGYTSRIVENVTGCVYIAGPPGADGRIMFTVADQLLHCSTTIVWNKDQFTLGRGKYQNKYEPIWFGWVENGTRFSEDRTLVNVWDIPRPKKSELHPTMKPIELVVKAINDASFKNDIVLDLFGGSGTTLIACEQTDRTCYINELDEKYCDVIIKRWEEFTGEKAVLINE